MLSRGVLSGLFPAGALETRTGGVAAALGHTTNTQFASKMLRVPSMRAVQGLRYLCRCQVCSRWTLGAAGCLAAVHPLNFHRSRWFTGPICRESAVIVTIRADFGALRLKSRWLWFPQSSRFGFCCPVTRS